MTELFWPYISAQITGSLWESLDQPTVPFPQFVCSIDCSSLPVPSLPIWRSLTAGLFCPGPRLEWGKWDVLGARLQELPALWGWPWTCPSRQLPHLTLVLPYSDSSANWTSGALRTLSVVVKPSQVMFTVCLAVITCHIHHNRIVFVPGTILSIHFPQKHLMFILNPHSSHVSG